MINYKRLLQESKDKKFNVLAQREEIKYDPYSCNYSPVSKHKYCEHSHCILDKEWREKDKERTNLQNRLKEEESYLLHGEGTVGYDRLSVYKNVLKLKNELKNLLGER